MKKIILILTLFCFLKAEQRFVVLDPASIETLFMLTSDSSIVGIASLQHSEIYPKEQSSKLASVGSFSDPSIEKIISLKPSLVILSSYSLNLKAKLENLGIKTLYLEAKNLNDIKKNVKILAELTQKQEQGEKLLENYEKELLELQSPALNKSTIYLFSSNPLMAFSDDTLMADILKLIGLKNLSQKSNIQKALISREFIFKQKPDFLLLGINATGQSIQKEFKTPVFFNDSTRLLLRPSPRITSRIKEFKTQLWEFLESF